MNKMILQKYNTSVKVSDVSYDIFQINAIKTMFFLYVFCFCWDFFGWGLPGSDLLEKPDPALA